MKLKRYGRKLYDLDRKKAVTLTRIREVALRGEDLQVIDGKDDSDRTALVLARLLVNELEAGHQVPAEPLRALLRALGAEQRKAASGALDLKALLDEDEAVLRRRRGD